MQSARSRLYFVNAGVDSFFVGGASIAFIVFLAILQRAGNNLSGVPLALGLAWFLNYPHFAATNHRLYSVRENLREYPLTAFAIPVLILVAMVMSLANHSFAQGFVKLVVYWSPYHFAGQMVGIMLIYVRRAGIRVARWERPLLSWCFYACYLYATAAAEQSHRMISYFGLEYPTFTWPEWAYTAVLVIVAMAIVSFVVIAVRWSRQLGRMVPPIVLLPAVTEFAWYILGPRLDAFASYQPLFHGVQYLFIAWMMQLKTRLDGKRAAPSARFAALETVRWFAVTMAISVALFWALPTVVDTVTHGSVVGSLGIVFAAVQLHHFFVDGVIWKLKSARVASPLMSALDDIVHAPSPVPTAAAAA